MKHVSAISPDEFILSSVLSHIIKLSHACLDDDELHWSTLVHEVMHMIFHMAGISFMEGNSEEAYVRCIESLIIPWIEENKPPIPKARKR